MFQCQKDLRDLFCDVEIEGIEELLLIVKESRTLDIVILQFARLESITKALQRHGVSIADVRVYVDDVIRMYPGDRNRLGCNASIAPQLFFESALVKAQNGLIEELTYTECDNVAALNIRMQYQ